jgi:hypothetical protein
VAGALLLKCRLAGEGQTLADLRSGEASVGDMILVLGCVVLTGAWLAGARPAGSIRDAGRRLIRTSEYGVQHVITAGKV